MKKEKTIQYIKEAIPYQKVFSATNLMTMGLKDLGRIQFTSMIQIK